MFRLAHMRFAHTPFQLAKFIVLAAALWGLACAAQAQSFTIKSADARLSGEQLSVGAEFDLKLNGTVTDALHSGIPVTLQTELSLSRVRPYLWDKKIASWQQKHTISYHSLSDRYQLRRPTFGETQSFATIREVLDDIQQYDFTSGLLRDNMPQSHHGYQLRLRVYLDLDALPSALRVVAWASPAWRLKSKTRRWQLD